MAAIGLLRPHPIARCAGAPSQGTATLGWLCAGWRGMGLREFTVDTLKMTGNLPVDHSELKSRNIHLPETPLKSNEQSQQATTSDIWHQPFFELFHPAWTSFAKLGLQPARPLTTNSIRFSQKSKPASTHILTAQHPDKMG